MAEIKTFTTSYARLTQPAPGSYAELSIPPTVGRRCPAPSLSDVQHHKCSASQRMM